MNKVGKIFSEIISNESEVKEFLSKETIEEMYKFFLTKDDSITVKEFDEYVADMLEEYLQMSENAPVEHLSEENLEIPAGGLSMDDFKKKIAPVALSALTLLPGMNTMASAAGVNAGNSNNVIQKVNKSDDVAQAASDKGFSRVGNFLKKHYKKIAVGLSVAAATVVAGIAVKKYNNHKNNVESKNNKTNNRQNSNLQEINERDVPDSSSQPPEENDEGGGDLLAAIRKGKRLKKTVTVVKDADAGKAGRVIDGNLSKPSPGANPSGTSDAKPSPGANPSGTSNTKPSPGANPSGTSDAKPSPGTNPSGTSDAKPLPNFGRKRNLSSGNKQDRPPYKAPEGQHWVRGNDGKFELKENKPEHLISVQRASGGISLKDLSGNNLRKTGISVTGDNPKTPESKSTSTFTIPSLRHVPKKENDNRKESASGSKGSPFGVTLNPVANKDKSDTSPGSSPSASRPGGPAEWKISNIPFSEADKF